MDRRCRPLQNYRTSEAKPEGSGPGGQHEVLRSRVRGAVSPALLRNAVWEFDPVQPVAWIAGLDERIARSMVTPRFYTLLLSFFATVALLLAAIGIFGTLAHYVASRTREIGVRMSLGAERGSLARGVVAHATGMVLGGVLIGVGVAVLLTRWMSVFLFAVEATDPLTYAVGATVLMLSGLVAAYIPSRRATRVDPATVLRD
jgi:putative ABC transport system permease protein